jgi:septum formation protein
LDKEIILASRSPRRQHLLGLVNIPFRVVIPGVTEKHFSDPVKSVRYNARLKCSDIARKIPDRIVLGVDTVVYLGGKVLGKPEDSDQAFDYLKMLSGHTHMVYSGICLSWDNVFHEGVEKTAVTFDTLSSDEIWHYIRNYTPLDKAGAYGIQEFSAFFIKSMNGDYFNVVGLPLNRFYKILKKIKYPF